MDGAARKCVLRQKKGVAAIFLDRDGVLNVKLPEGRYVKTPEELIMLPGAVSALRLLKQLGYLLVVVTNQRGIALGYMDDDDLGRVHELLRERLAAQGVALDGLYYCPHDDEARCDCRKPQSGMLYRASEELGISLAASYMVGDSAKDVEAGKNAGTKTVRISTEHDALADFTFPSLLDFALFLKNDGRKDEGDAAHA
ncbi:MAG: D-glycero-alpha-D-manno-heptose-1,7-bisphosphate 7-phosphatase [Desulfomonilaceae bacterium]